MSDAKTTVLQAPELRCLDNVKASLNIGEREPTASGSFQPGIGGVGINPLVNTQFQYIDIGVNIEATARIHSDSEVTVDMLLNITSVTGQVNLGGIQQPIIGQRKIQHSLRIREGEVALLGGLVTRQDDKTITGIPGLSSIPLLGNLFKGSNVDHNRDDIVIAVIPHIIRKPDFTEENMRAVAVGATSIKISYAPPTPEEVAIAPTGKGVVGAPLAAGAPPATAPPIGSAATVPATTSPATVPATGSPASMPPLGAAIPGMPGRLGAPPVTVAPGMPPATAPPLGAPPATAPSTAPPACVRWRFISRKRRLTRPQARLSPSRSSPITPWILARRRWKLKFDPKMLRLNDVAAGDLLSQGRRRAATDEEYSE